MILCLLFVTGDESITGLSFEIGSTEVRDSWDLAVG